MVIFPAFSRTVTLFKEEMINQQLRKSGDVVQNWVAQCQIVMSGFE
jgi:hypothetical protein